jgi:hypothetical protein
MRIRTECAVWTSLVAVLVSGCPAAAAGAGPDLLPVEGIRSVTVTVRLRAFTPEEATWTGEFTESDSFEQLVDVLRGAAPAEDHKCPDVGTIILQYGEGKSVRLGILPGHDETAYQFRLYGGGGYSIHQVDRTVFLAALKGLGCPVDDPGFPR